MAVRTREELVESFKEIFSDDTSDRATQFIADTLDTYDNLSETAKMTESDWQKKYNDLNNEWTTKYRNRFYEGSEEPVNHEPKNNANNSVRINDLFTRKDV